MSDDKKMHICEPVEGCVEQTGSARNDDRALAPESNLLESCGGLECLGLLALDWNETPAAIWAIPNVMERALALDKMLPSQCEDPAWVELIRSVNVPAAGEVGAAIQCRIGSELAWAEGLKRWKQWMKGTRKSLDEEKSDFKNFEMLYGRSAREGRPFLTKEQYHEKAFDEWLWEFGRPSDTSLSAEEITKSKTKTFESGNKWLAEIEEKERYIHYLELDLREEGDFLYEYTHRNLSLAGMGYSRMTRAEAWSGRKRYLYATQPSLYRAWVGDFVLPSVAAEYASR